MSNAFHIVGIDEAGRGPLAGPVCAAAVVLGSKCSDLQINDSKKMSEAKREALYDQIIHHALCYDVALVTHEEIDSINILQATFLAMKRAADGVRRKLGAGTYHFLVDGNKSFDTNQSVEPIVKGDGKLRCIGAASILAKVTRDRLMQSAASEYPEYAFEAHKGYPTKTHKELIAKFGPSPIHRKTFRGVKEHIR